MLLLLQIMSLLKITEVGPEEQEEAVLLDAKDNVNDVSNTERKMAKIDQDDTMHKDGYLVQQR